MTLYASKTPRENNDPEPFQQPWPGLRRSEGRSPFNIHDRWVFNPRPEFDHAQHNEPNRVLIHIRKNWADASSDTKRILINIHQNILRSHVEEHAGEDGYCRLTDDTLAMIAHARRVLARLERLART